MERLKKLLLIKMVAVFLITVLAAGDAGLIAGQSSDAMAHFTRAQKDYKSGEFLKVTNRLERLLGNIPESSKGFRGQVYLLLGAAYEKQGKVRDARKKYKLAVKSSDQRKIEGLNFSSLSEYNKIVITAKINQDSGLISKESGKGSKKKFPIVIVLVGVALVGVLLAVLSKKKDDPAPNPSTTGSINVTSSPDGANILLDDSDTGYTTPTTLSNIATGSHTITLKKTGYDDFTGSVTVTAGQEATFSGSMTEFSSGITWITVSSGTFKMGDNFNEIREDEQPVHDVSLDQYSISKQEITFNQYDDFCDSTSRSKPDDSGWGRGKNPVINVSWEDAKAYCDWVAEKTGENIHLPTEAQWEKAAKGTNQWKYPWGNNTPTTKLCNYNSNEGKTVPVSGYPTGKSPYGVHDMAGNVSEWVADWYDANYYSSSSKNNPTGPASGTERVLRGGSWYHYWHRVRAVDRASEVPGFKDNTIGFRVAKD